MRNRTSDRRIPRSDALPLSHRDFTASEVYYEVHMTRVLYTARISDVDSVMFGHKIRKTASFQLGKEIEKDVSDSALRCSTTEPPASCLLI